MDNDKKRSRYLYLDERFYDQLESAIAIMTPRTRIYKTLRRVLMSKGLWTERRGRKPSKRPLRSSGKKP